jgi:hypothetical protein
MPGRTFEAPRESIGTSEAHVTVAATKLSSERVSENGSYEQEKNFGPLQRRDEVGTAVWWWLSQPLPHFRDTSGIGSWLFCARV